MKAEIQTVKDLTTGRPQRITYLIPETENDLALLRDMAATGESETEINPQDDLAERDGDDEDEEAQMRADSIQDEEAHQIRRALERPLLEPAEVLKRIADLEPANYSRALQAIGRGKRAIRPR